MAQINPPMPPLTKHIYREDECIAALKWSIMFGKQEESLFWAEECIDSKMHGELLEALLWAWCFSCGPSALPWIEVLHDRIQKGITEEDMYQLTYILLHWRRSSPDASAFVLLSLGLSSKGEQIEAPDYLTRNECKTKTPLERAIEQGKIELAWYIARPLWETLSWSTLFPKAILLSTIHDWFPVWDPEMLWPIRAVTLVAGATLKAPAPIPVVEIPEWNLEEIPMRKRRIYSIPTDCLFLFTQRGQMSITDTTDTDLTHHLETNLHGSQFWDEYISSLHETDIQREKFYDTFFPNDIPDEWSKADREKSHGSGYGVIHTNEECFRRWFYHLPSRIWKGLPRALEIWKMKELSIPMKSFTNFFHVAYLKKMDLWKERMKTWKFPLYKRVFISL
jgi:hypothetical protein